MLVSLTACTHKASVAGVWKMTSMDFSEFYKTIPKEMRKKMKAEMDQQIGMLKNHAFFDIKEKGTYRFIIDIKIKGKSIPPETGNWKLSKNQDSIFFEKRDAERFKIVKLTSEEMILETDEAPKRKLFLTLKK